MSENIKRTQREWESLGYKLHHVGDLMVKEDNESRELCVYAGSNDSGEKLFKYVGWESVCLDELRRIG